MTAIDTAPEANTPANGTNGPRLLGNSLTFWVSDNLLNALREASAEEEESVSTIARRWLRMAARAQGYPRPKVD